MAPKPYKCSLSPTCPSFLYQKPPSEHRKQSDPFLYACYMFTTPPPPYHPARSPHTLTGGQPAVGGDHTVGCSGARVGCPGECLRQARTRAA
jgi:hypothetical protein